MHEKVSHFVTQLINKRLTRGVGDGVTGLNVGDGVGKGVGLAVLGGGVGDEATQVCG